MLSRREFIKAVGASAVSFAVAGKQQLLFANSNNRPNIVFIISDDISISDHGVYGHPNIQTPNIDKLANDGLRVNNAYLTAPQCSPTRCSVITGRYPHNTGAPELHMPLPESQLMFPKLLKDSGYYCAARGKWHLGNYARDAFDDIADSRPSGCEKWVEALQNRPKDKPFFMWFASHDAHRGWDQGSGAEPAASGDAVVPPYQMDTQRTREDIAKYMGEVQRLDSYVGDVVSELDRQGVLDNTIVMYISDNGRPFPRDKAWLYDSGIKTPLIVHWHNGLKRSGMVSDALVSTIDIAPTLLEIAGLDVPETVQGVSFSELFQNPGANIRDYAFAELNWHTQYSHMRAVRWQNYLYIRNSAPELCNMMMASINREYAPWMDLWEADAEELTPAQKNVLQAHSKVPGSRPEEELYDIAEDPHQLNNLAGDPEHKQALDHLHLIMDAWAEGTGDSVADPELRTADRYDRETGESTGASFSPPRYDYAGKARNAEKNNYPGPILSGKPICLNKPEMDISDDCEVNINDLVKFVSKWLESGMSH